MVSSRVATLVSGTASARFPGRRGHSGLTVPPSFLSAGTKGPLLIELVGRSVWRSSFSEVYSTLLLIWEPECDFALPGLARSARSGGALRRGAGDWGPRLRGRRLSGTASAWPALPGRLCRAVSIALCAVGNLVCKPGLAQWWQAGPDSWPLKSGNPLQIFLGLSVSLCRLCLCFCGTRERGFQRSQ